MGTSYHTSCSTDHITDNNASTGNNASVYELLRGKWKRQIPLGSDADMDTDLDADKNGNGHLQSQDGVLDSPKIPCSALKHLLGLSCLSSSQ